MPGSDLQKTPGGYTVQVGVGYEIANASSLELMVGHHWLGEIFYSYSAFVGEPNIDSRVRLVPVTLNLTRRFKLGEPQPYLTVGAGGYVLFFDRIQSETSDESSTHLGFNAGFGFESPPGEFGVRLDIRAHAIPLTGSEYRYSFSENDDWMRLLIFAIGVQLP